MKQNFTNNSMMGSFPNANQHQQNNQQWKNTNVNNNYNNKIQNNHQVSSDNIQNKSLPQPLMYHVNQASNVSLSFSAQNMQHPTQQMQPQHPSILSNVQTSRSQINQTVMKQIPSIFQPNPINKSKMNFYLIFSIVF